MDESAQIFEGIVISERGAEDCGALQIVFEDWGGVEEACVEVRQSDLVSEAIQKFADQSVARPLDIRLISGHGFAREGQFIDADSLWSAFSMTHKRPHVIVTALIHDEANMFSPLELDQEHIGPGVVINPSNPLLIIGPDPGITNTMQASRGIEVKSHSGQRGYFEWRSVVGASSGYVLIGVATHQIDLTYCVGTNAGGFGWTSAHPVNMFCRIAGLTPGNVIVRFADGDTIGLMVDCRDQVPMLRFFKNRAQVHEEVFADEALGTVLYPTFSLWSHIQDPPTSRKSQIQIALEPTAPI